MRVPSWIAFVLVVLGVLVVAVSAIWLTDDDDDAERVDAVEETTTITIEGLGGPTSTSAPTTTAPVTTTTIPPTTAAATTAPTTVVPTTVAPTTVAPTTVAPPVTLDIAPPPPPTTMPPTTLPPTTLAPTTLPTTTVPPTTLSPTPSSPALADGSVVGCQGAPGGTRATVRVVHRSGPPAAFRVAVEFYDGARALNGSGSATSRVVNPQAADDVAVFIPSTASSGTCRILGGPVAA